MNACHPSPSHTSLLNWPHIYEWLLHSPPSFPTCTTHACAIHYVEKHAPLASCRRPPGNQMYTQHRFIFTSVHWYTTTICCTVLFKAQNTQVIYFHDQNILCKIPILHALLKKGLHHWSQTLKRPSTAMFFSAPVDIQHPWTTPFFQLDALKSTEIPVWQLVTAMHTSRDGEGKCERPTGVLPLIHISASLYLCKYCSKTSFQ